MPQFVLKNNDPATKPIEWSLEIDEDGDLNLIANNERLFYISALDGALHRYIDYSFNERFPDLKFDDARIDVAN